MHSQHRSPENLYADLSSSAIRAVENVKGFTALVQQPANQEVLARAKESRLQSPDGITAWLVTQHPDWLEQPALLEEEDLPQEGKTDPHQLPPTSEQAEEILDKFREQHVDVEVTTENEGHNFKVGGFSVQG